eukprot:1182450-Prymnesium_polylepis.2
MACVRPNMAMRTSRCGRRWRRRVGPRAPPPPCRRRWVRLPWDVWWGVRWGVRMCRGVCGGGEPAVGSRWGLRACSAPRDLSTSAMPAPSTCHIREARRRIRGRDLRAPAQCQHPAPAILGRHAAVLGDVS